MLRRRSHFSCRAITLTGEPRGALLEQARAVRLQGAGRRGAGCRRAGPGIPTSVSNSSATPSRPARDELPGCVARLGGPLALDSVYIASHPRRTRPGCPHRHQPAGPAAATLDRGGAGPAGGIRASIQDLVRLAGALLDGTAPGMSALDPVATFAGPAVRVGAAWLILDAEGRQITWHNGGTGGFSSWIGFNREAKAGVVLLSATAAPVDRPGFELLQETGSALKRTLLSAPA